MNFSILSLGSNLGDKKNNILSAYKLISSSCGLIKRKSNFYENKAIEFESMNSFINTVILIETKLNPKELLFETQKIEKKLGRKNKSLNNIYTDRIIDIDIILFNDFKIATSELIIPHPKYKERIFVLKPLSEILINNEFNLNLTEINNIISKLSC